MSSKEIDRIAQLTKVAEWNDKAYDLCQQGKQEKAIIYFAKIVDVTPEDTAALNGMGGCLNALKQYQEALPFFERVLKLEPNNIDALANMGMTLIWLDRANEASEYVRRMYRVDPERAQKMLADMQSLIK